MGEFIGDRNRTRTAEPFFISSAKYDEDYPEDNIYESEKTPKSSKAHGGSGSSERPSQGGKSRSNPDLGERQPHKSPNGGNKKHSSSSGGSRSGHSGSTENPKSGRSSSSSSKSGHSSSSSSRSSHSGSSSSRSSHSGSSNNPKKSNSNGSSASRNTHNSTGSPRRSDSSGSKRGRPLNTAVQRDNNERIYSSELRETPEAIELKRERGRRRYRKRRKLLSFLFYFSIAAAVIALTVILSTTVLFNIETLQIEREGELPYSDEQILACSGVHVGQNMFTPAVFSASDYVETALPYIEECKIVRQLPSGVTIKLTPAEILGVVGSKDGRLYVVTTSGRAVERVTIESDVSSCAGLSGIYIENEPIIGHAVEFDVPERFELAHRIIEGFRETGIEIDTIDFSENGEISVNYDSRLVFKFGQPNGLEDKIVLAATLVNEGKITKIEAGRVDLSIEGKATFTPNYLLDD